MSYEQIWVIRQTRSLQTPSSLSTLFFTPENSSNINFYSGSCYLIETQPTLNQQFPSSCIYQIFITFSSKHLVRQKYIFLTFLIIFKPLNNFIFFHLFSFTLASGGYSLKAFIKIACEEEDGLVGWLIDSDSFFSFFCLLLGLNGFNIEINFLQFY